MPEEILCKIRNKILPQWKACFFSALFAGLLAHLYKLTNWLPNWDSLVFRYDVQNMLGLGRWFLPVAAAPSSFYDLPWLTGLMAILFYALGAVIICMMFGVQKKMTAILIGATVASFPTVTSVLTYNYVADAYGLSFLLACAAALLLVQKKPRYIAAAVLIALSVGIYQAYITTTITLLLCYLIIALLQKNAEPKAVVLQGLKFLAGGACGMALYYAVLTALLRCQGESLIAYQGLDQAGSLSNFNILATLYTIKESFFNYFFDVSNGFSFFVLFNILIFVGIFVFYFIDLIKNKTGLLKFLILCALVIMLPLGTSVLSVVNSDIDYHNLMNKGFLAFYLLFVLQYENPQFQNKRRNAGKSWVILSLTLLLVFNHVVIANVSYHKLNMAYEKSYGTLIRIADRIEQTEGALECDKIAVIGALPESEAYSAVLPPDITGTTDGYIIRADDEIVGQSVLCSALNDYCGKRYTFLAGEEKQAITEKAALAGMGNWPEKGSICVIDDVIAIKLGD